MRTPRKPATPGRPWPVTIGGYAVVAQAVALLAGGLILLPDLTELTALRLLPAARAALPGGLLVGLAAFALTAGLRFLQLRRSAWLMALAVQALVLAVGLALYYYVNPLERYAFPLLLVGVVMVVHLNRADVSAPFHLERRGSTHAH